MFQPLAEHRTSGDDDGVRAQEDPVDRDHRGRSQLLSPGEALWEFGIDDAGSEMGGFPHYEEPWRMSGVSGECHRVGGTTGIRTVGAEDEGEVAWEIWW